MIFCFVLSVVFIDIECEGCTMAQTELEQEAFMKAKIYQPLAELMVHQQADELAVEGKLLESREQYVKNHVTVLTEQLYAHSKKMEKRFKSAGALLKAELDLIPAAEKAIYEKDLSQAMDLLTKLGENPEAIDKKEIRMAANTYQEFLGLSNNTLLWIYSIGHKLFEERKGEEAYGIFQLLVSLNSLVSDYWVALGFVQHFVKEQQESLNSFSMASILNPENPISRYQSAKIYLELSQFDDARVELEVLEKIITTQPLEHLKPSLVSLKNQLNSLQSLS